MKFKTAQPWTAQPVVAPGTELESATPARSAGLVADVLVPLLQSAVTGVLLAGLFVLLLSELKPDFRGDLLRIFVSAALAISTVAWLLLLGQTRRLLWAVERWTGRDLDGDDVTGKPQERVVIVNAGKAQREAEQRAGAERASEFARFVAAIPARGTSLRAWESELGRETYGEYRDALIRLGWARWCSTKADGTPNERRGWELAVDAADILRLISG